VLRRSTLRELSPTALQLVLDALDRRAGLLGEGLIAQAENAGADRHFAGRMYVSWLGASGSKRTQRGLAANVGTVILPVARVPRSSPEATKQAAATKYLVRGRLVRQRTRFCAALIALFGRSTARVRD